MSRARTRLLALTSALVLAFGLGVVTLTPAHADGLAYQNCYTNQFCIWKVSAGDTPVNYYWTLTGMVNGHCTNIGYPWDNQARAGMNQVANSYTIQLWTGANCTGLVISQMRSWTFRTSSCNGHNWVILHSSCSAPTVSSFRYVF